MKWTETMMITNLGTVEESWVLIGKRRGRAVMVRRRRYQAGTAGNVKADSRWAFAREDEHPGQVVGFEHTHPIGMSTSPSQTDIDTMRTWVQCFGRAMLCVIGNYEHRTCWKFNRSGTFERANIKRIFGDLSLVWGGG